jgi:hypothetical protein
MSDYNPNRVSAGKSDGGQFAAKVNGEQDIDLDISSDTDTFSDPYAALSAEGNKPVTLTYVEHGDSLTEDQIDSALRGDWDRVSEDVEDQFRDGSYSEAKDIAEKEINYLHSEGKFHAEWDDLDEDQQHEAALAVQTRDDSNPVADLIKQTPDQNLRVSAASTDEFTGHYPKEGVKAAIASFPEGVDIDDVLGDDEDGKYTEERMALVTGVLKDHGVEDADHDITQLSVRTFVETSYTNWENCDIDVVWRGSVSEVTPSTPENQHETFGRTVAIRNPELVMSQYGDEGTECAPCSIPVDFQKNISGSDIAKVDENPYGRSRNYSSVDTKGWLAP